ncbi:hypothetical protein [Coleofasciculus sp.]|uniref:hypothetical protein n=1 Tax=Coleofasciculus sp. TaxID=3100458 RepID=UPI0039F7B281
MVSNMPLLNPNQSYTFSKIFELQIEPEDFVTEFGYTLERIRLNIKPINALANFALYSRVGRKTPMGGETN